MITDYTYFTKRLNLPQVGNSAGRKDVNDYIEQYEREYLQCVLGRDLWQILSDQTEGSGLPTDERILNLLEGAEFTLHGKVYYWGGFKNEEKISPIANYVFYQYVDERQIDFTLVGNVKSTTENNRVEDATPRLVYAWNRMVDMNRILFNYLKANKTLFPEWNVCKCGCSCFDYCGCPDEMRMAKPCCDLYKYKNSLGI